MPSYECQLRTTDGSTIKTVLQAPDMSALKKRLQEEGYQLVSAKAKAEGFSLKAYLAKYAKIKQKDLMVFTVQLSTLVGANVPLIESVQALADQTENPKMKEVLQKVMKKLRGGGSLSDALEEHPLVFSNIFCNMVKAGEKGGILDKVLERLAGFAEADSKMRSKIKSTLTFPALTISFAILGVVFLVTVVFPKFLKLFKKMKVQLPAPTRFLIWLSNFLKTQYIKIFLGIAAIVGAYKALTSTKKGKRVVDLVLLNAPLFGPLAKKIAVGRFARTFSSLISAGVTIIEALAVTEKVMGNIVLEEVISDMRANITRGMGLAKPLMNHPIFPTLVVKMMDIGEQTGNLDVMLEKVGDFYDSEVEDELAGLTSAIEPVVIVFMGGAIMFIALSVFLPLFNMISKMN
ncbi:type II secretion system F family protein [Candidatus Riflebacteria bacterium]